MAMNAEPFGMRRELLRPVEHRSQFCSVDVVMD
jgi:hypothetical protein